MRDKTDHVFTLENLKIRVVELSEDNWVFDLRSTGFRWIPSTSTQILSQDSLLWGFRLMHFFFCDNWKDTKLQFWLPEFRTSGEIQ